MKAICNVLWFLTFGLALAIIFAVLGVAFCCTLILIPFGLQCFKIARLAICPVGKALYTNFDIHPIGTMLWNICGMIVFPIIFLILSTIFHITIIGIPFGKQFFKLARISFLPFGAEVN